MAADFMVVVAVIPKLMNLLQESESYTEMRYYYFPHFTDKGPFNEPLSPLSNRNEWFTLECYIIGMGFCRVVRIC